MKLFLPSLTLSIVAVSVSLYAAPDFSALDGAVTDFFKAMDVIAKKLPTVDDAAGTAEVVNAWAQANENFAEVGERFAAENPDLIKQKTPPPEFVAAVGRLSRLKTDYAAVPNGVSALMKRFQTDPQVAEAMKRFQKSIQRVVQLGQKG